MAVEETEGNREDRAVEATEGRRGSMLPLRGQRPQREYRAVEGTRLNLFIAIIASQLSRLSLKLSFSRKTIIVWSLFFRKKRSDMIIIINPIHKVLSIEDLSKYLTSLQLYSEPKIVGLA